MKILFLFLLVSTNALSQDFFNNKTPVTVPKLQDFAAGRTLANYPIPSVEFQWKVLGVKKDSSTGGGFGVDVEIGEVILADIRDKKLRAALVVRGNLEQSRMSDWTNDPCKRDDFLWKQSTGGKFSNQNCVFINHRVGFFKAPTGIYQQILADLRDINLDMPPTVMTVEFTRYASSGRYLIYRYEINPEFFGFARDNETVWGASNWHKSRVQSDPAKVAFIGGLSRWANDVQSKMDDAFSKRSDAFNNIKSLESYLGIQENQKPSQSLSMEARLEQLKSLRDKNLITLDQYNQQVGSILSGK